VLHFGEYELDVPSFELRRDGTRVDAEPQVIELLIFLACNQGRLVRKEELLDEIWGDRFVSESALTSRIKSARRAVGDDGRAQSVIRTVHGRGYQFLPNVTDSDAEPAVPTAPLPDVSSAVDAARTAFEAGRLAEACGLYEALGAEALEVADLERWAEATWWQSDAVGSIGINQLAFRRHEESGDRQGAARVAIALCDGYLHRGATAVSNAWLDRAEALLDGLPPCPERGMLLRMRGERALSQRGDPALALELNDGLAALLEQVDDVDLRMFALQDRGRCLVALGRVEEGLALIDRAMVQSSSERIGPGTTGRLYCNMLSTCVGLTFYDRARDWSDEAITWCADHRESPFPGLCQVYRSSLRRRMGELRATIGDLRESASCSFSDVAGAALAELGEIHLRLGELDEAEAVLLQAHAHGNDARVGIAQLLLARDQPAEALALLTEGQRSAGSDPIALGRLLPVVVEAATAAGDLARADRAAGDLEAVAPVMSSAMTAAAAHARGTVALAQGRADEASAAFRRAIDGFSSAGLPYEAALARLGIAAACRAGDDCATEALEIDVAQRSLERLDAVPMGMSARWLAAAIA
jgi:DNA-binding winged helix-turn-helix (wHTH) protein